MQTTRKGLRPEESEQLLLLPGKSLPLCLVPVCLNPHPHLSCWHKLEEWRLEGQPLILAGGSLPSKHPLKAGRLHVADSAEGGQEAHSSSNM